MVTEIKINPGTAVIWTSSGGDEVLTLTSLANGDGRAGDLHDFGDPFPRRIQLVMELDFNSGPTAGYVVNLYWASSHDGTDFDGECTGSDSAYNAEEDMRRLYYVGSLICTNDTDPQRQSWVFELPARYGLPVVSNQSGVALTSTGTNQIVTVIPLVDEVQ